MELQQNDDGTIEIVDGITQVTVEQ